MDQHTRDGQKQKHLINRILILALLAGVFLFGIVLPGSFTDHYRLLHFSAHFGMSFLIAYFVYRLCTIKLRLKKKPSFILSFAITGVVGIIYKYFEILPVLPPLKKFPLGTILETTGFYTSVSENISGALAAVLCIIFFDNNFSKRKKNIVLKSTESPVKANIPSSKKEKSLPVEVS